jgi:hypothetical protein
MCREVPVKITNINFHTNVFEVFHEDRRKGEATERCDEAIRQLFAIVLQKA